MSWTSKHTTFRRVDGGAVGAISRLKLEPGTVVFAEKPTVVPVVTNLDPVADAHRIFCMTCALKWSTMTRRQTFPCTFNPPVGTDDIGNALFTGKGKKIASDLGYILQSTCGKEYLYTGSQVFRRDDKDYNCARIVLGDGNTFISTCIDVELGEELVFSDHTDLQCDMWKDFFKNTVHVHLKKQLGMSRSTNIDTEEMLRGAVEMLDVLTPLPCPDDGEIKRMGSAVMSMDAAKKMGLLGFKAESERLTHEVSKIDDQDWIGVDAMEQEFDRLRERFDMNAI